MGRVNPDRKVGTYVALMEFNKLPVDFRSPTDEIFELEFYMPTVAEVWQMLREMPPEPKPGISRYEPFKDGVKPVYDFMAADYLLAVEDWNREASNRQVLLTWGNNLEGNTPEEKIAALEAMPAMVGAALRRGARMAIQLAEGAVSERKF